MAKKSTSNLFNEEEEKKVPEKVEEAKVEESPIDDGIEDVDLSIIQKKRFRINRDNNKILELNVSDLGIAHRLSEAYPRLNKFMDEIVDKLQDVNISEGEEVTEEDFSKVSKAIDEIDKKMRKEMDFIFNAPVSEVCGSDGSMWDPIEGSFRYEHIIEKLSSLYENNLNKEFSKMKRRVEMKTGKYANVSKIKR